MALNSKSTKKPFFVNIVGFVDFLTAFDGSIMTKSFQRGQNEVMNSTA